MATRGSRCSWRMAHRAHERHRGHRRRHGARPSSSYAASVSCPSRASTRSTPSGPRGGTRCGGRPVIEVTLRTAAALQAIELSPKTGRLLVGGARPNARAGRRCQGAGARFAVSPGLDPSGGRALPRGSSCPAPGDRHRVRAHAGAGEGLTLVKLFPAEVDGRSRADRALAAPFPGGALRADRRDRRRERSDYLRHPAVAAIGVAGWSPRRCSPRGDYATVERLRPRRSSWDARRDDGREPRPPGRDDCRFDLVSLGEVMLRLDPGEGRIRTARHFNVWEGGGEYNVARGLRRCFGCDRRRDRVRRQRGRPARRGLHHAGRRRHDFIKWRHYDGIGRSGAQRAQLHRARLRRARRGRHPDRGNTAAAAAQARRLRLGPHLRQARRALVPHRRHLRRALRDHAATHRRGREGRQQARHDRLLRPQLPALPLENDRRQARRRRRSTARSPRMSTS